jgi:hypothetical protein
MTAAAEARSGWTAVPLFARMRAREGASQRPCLMLRAPSRYTAEANHRVPVEMMPIGDGKLAIGYAASATEARGMLVDLADGTTEEVFAPDELKEPLARVVPLSASGEVKFEPTPTERDGVNNGTYVPAANPFLVGFEGGTALVRLEQAGAEKVQLWSLDPQGPGADALSVLPLGEVGTGIAYRHAGRILYGLLDGQGGTKHPAKQVAGSGGIVGKPNLGSNGAEVSVVFADKPEAKTAPIEIRWAHAALDASLTVADALELPSGGPGGDAIAPAIAGVPGGRWLLMWTEGIAGSQVLRAQTYDRKYRPLGEALRVSPETGSFGQGMVGVVGETAAVVFFRATAGTYEIWGTVLQCE